MNILLGWKQTLYGLSKAKIIVVCRRTLPGVVLLAAMSLMVGDLPASRTMEVESKAAPKGLTPTQWVGIREAHEAWKRRVMPDGKGWKATNAGHGLSASFDRRGFEVKAENGDWRWGLDLTSYGVGDAQESIEGRTPRVGALEQRLGYEWDENIEEWYINDSRGLEHGYTIRNRPESNSREELLTLRLVIPR